MFRRVDPSAVGAGVEEAIDRIKTNHRYLGTKSQYQIKLPTASHRVEFTYVVTGSTSIEVDGVECGINDADKDKR